MHLYVLARGIKHDFDRMINDLQAQYLPYKSHPNYKKNKMVVQLSVRPVQLFELVFPREELDTVQGMLWDNNLAMNTRDKMGTAMVRKMLGAKKVPKFDESIPRRLIYRHNVACYPVGIKEDTNDPEDEHENL